MPAGYTDAASVAAALRLEPDTTLAQPCVAGANVIYLTQAQVASGSQLYPGQYLALDQYNASVRETVQITGAVSGQAVPITPTLYAHGGSTPVKEVSALEDVVDAGSRLWDDACFTYPGAFAQQSWTETIESQAMSDGRLLTQVTGRNVSAITSISWQYNPSSAVYLLDPTQCTYLDYQVYSWPPQALPFPFHKSILVAITYTAGYNPIPGDIKRASTVLAARLYKEGDTGFSDVLADPNLGLLSYKKPIPTDIALMVKRWRRWT